MKKNTLKKSGYLTKCTVCGKVTGGRLARTAEEILLGNYFPRLHMHRGKRCSGSFLPTMPIKIAVQDVLGFGVENG